MRVLGINAVFHDSAAALAAEGGLTPDDLDAVAHSYDPALVDPTSGGLDPSWEHLRTTYAARAPNQRRPASSLLTICAMPPPRSTCQRRQLRWSSSVPTGEGQRQRGTPVGAPRPVASMSASRAPSGKTRTWLCARCASGTP